MKSKLKQLFDMIYEETQHNELFREKIEALFEIKPTIKKEKKIKPQAPLETLTVLNQEGAEALSTRLHQLSDDELLIICTAERITKPKKSPVFPREFIISELITDAQKRLSKGTSFL